MNGYNLQTNDEVKQYLKRYKKACIHFCGKCWVRFVCPNERKTCKANKKELCGKCSGKDFTDKELEEYF